MKQRIRYIALATDVLAVAKEGYAGDWTAYIGAVPGMKHEDEYGEVLRTGCKLPKNVAMVLFPDFSCDLDWRD